MHLVHLTDIDLQDGKLRVKNPRVDILAHIDAQIDDEHRATPTSVLCFADETVYARFDGEGESFWFILADGVFHRFFSTGSATPTVFAFAGDPPASRAYLASVATDSTTDQMITDLSGLIEALCRTSWGHAISHVGRDAHPKSAAMLSVMSELNRLDPAPPPIFDEIIGPSLLSTRRLTAAHTHGGIIDLDLFLPLKEFWYVGLDRRDDQTPIALITHHNKSIVAFLDAGTLDLYSHVRPAEIGLDAGTIRRALLYHGWLRRIIPVPDARGRRRAGIVLREEHIAHYIWNELSAVDALARSDAEISAFLYETCQEPVFPVDLVFPELAGKVDRHIADPARLLAAAMNGVEFLPFASMKVSEDLAKRVAGCALRAEAAFADRLELTRFAATVILVGLRLENRCWLDQAKGYKALVRRLAARTPERFTIVFDGHNYAYGQTGRFLASLCETDEIGADGLPPIVRREIDLINDVAAAAKSAGHDNVEIIGLVPCSMAASIVAALKADYLITHFGAGLAKYKWIANGDGLVLTSRKTLADKFDLRIFDTEPFRENATPLTYIPADLISDLDQDSNLVRLPFVSFYRNDFQIDPETFADVVVPLVLNARARRAAAAL